MQRNAIDDLLTLQGTVLRKGPDQLDPAIEMQAKEATHKIGQFGVIKIELQRLKALTAATQFQLMVGLIRCDAHKTTFLAKRVAYAGQSIPDKGNHCPIRASR